MSFLYVFLYVFLLKLISFDVSSAELSSFFTPCGGCDEGFKFLAV